jgi:hypothetical protein
LFEPAIFDEWFRMIARGFAWEDKFWQLLPRFDRLGQPHSSFKLALMRCTQELLWRMIPAVVAFHYNCLVPQA